MIKNVTKNSFAIHENIKSIEIYGHPLVNDTFTIAIPTYKRAKYLEETLVSALSQVDNLYPYNIIVVDNNPERGDETELLMSKYNCESNISYYKNSANLGMQGNWNRLFVLTKTKYVIMLHDDDLLNPLFMSTVQRCISETKLHITVVKPLEQRWHDNGESVRYDRIIGDIRMKRVYDLENYHGFPIGAPTGCLFDRDDIIKIGGFDLKLNIAAADFELIVRLGREFPVYQINQSLVVYRILVNNASNLEVQYLGSDRCYKIVKKLLHSYYFPNWLIDGYWSYFLKSWTHFIHVNFCQDFDYDIAMKRIGMKPKSPIYGLLCYVVVRIYERIFMLFHGRIVLLNGNCIPI